MSSPRSKREAVGRGALVIATIAFLLLLICPASLAQIDHVYSGKTYSYQVPPPPVGLNYEYLWSASDGSPVSDTNRIFNWTAPVVDAPKEVTIKVIVSDTQDGGCKAADELKLVVVPIPAGQISLEKQFNSDPNNVKLGDIVSYTINITNTGQTNVTFLPLVDNYPNEFLKSVSSNPQWNLDSGSILSWNNLLNAPLAVGQSIKVSVSFRVINVTDQPIVNLAKAVGAKDDMGDTLSPQEGTATINGIKYVCQKLGPDAGCVGIEEPFSAHLDLPSYRWEALDVQGSSVGGFDDPSKADVKWTPPRPGTFEISFNNLRCKQPVTVKQCNSSIKIIKNCKFTSPVRVGDLVTYIYNVTNTGDLPLKDVKVNDVPDWGPGCTPEYVGGDNNGNNILDPSETWRYECANYKIPDPLDYQRLTIMSDQSSAQQERIIQKLMNSRARLEIMLNKLKQLRIGFNKTLAKKTAMNITTKGVNYTRYNYTGKLVGETLIETLNQTGAINSSMYIDPISESTLTSRYGNKGQLISDAYNSNRTKESLLIEYNKPSMGYMTYTIIDHVNGDSLIIIIDSNGNILSKQYKKTPGEMIFKTTLKNVANVTAIDPRGATVSDIDAFLLEIERPLPELGISKNAEPDPVQAGKTLTYTISYKNTGNETAHSVVINENYDKNVTFAYSSPLPAPGSNNIWNLGDLGKGVSGTITINVNVNSSVKTGTLLVNNVGISCAEKIIANASVSTTVENPLPALSIAKKAEPNPVQAGNTLTYTISYQNTGNGTAHSAVINENYDKNVTFLSSLPLPAPGSNNVWNLGDLGQGVSGTITINVNVNSSVKTGTLLVNTVGISCAENIKANASITTTVENPLPALSIAKKAEPNPVLAGNTLTYTISYQNIGNGTAHSVVINENYDKNVTFLSSSPLPAPGSNSIWNLGDLVQGVSGTIKINVNVNSSVQNGTLLVNTVGISCAGKIIANASVSTTVLHPLLQINKTASKQLISNSTEFDYTITYKNIGKVDATNVIIDDIVDPYLVFLNSNPEPSSSNGFHKIWNIPRLNATAPGTIVMHVQARDSIPKSVNWVCNLYKISSNETQGIYRTLCIPVVHSLWIRKTAERSSYSPGELINYTIEYGNDEPCNGTHSTANDVTIWDNLPDVELVAVSPTPVSIQGQKLIWGPYTIPCKTERIITLQVKIKERPTIKFDESGSVSGNGYIYDRKTLSTNLEPYNLANYVNISGTFDNETYNTDSDSVTVGVSDPGTEIDTVEHGSGYYQQEQHVSYNSSNKSIRLDKKIFAKHAPTTLSLSRNRKLDFNSLWFDRTSAKNYVRNEKVSENYLYMDLINKESSFLVDPNQTVYKSSGDFYGGKAQIAYTKSEPRTIPGPLENDMDIHEDYHGSFKVAQSLDSYGEVVTYSKSANGNGFVDSDKRIGKTQRSFETGSGDYKSDEVIRTGLVYKDSTMTYAPNNLTAGGFKTNYSSKWHEEMWTRNPDIGAAISERIGFADNIKKETLMQDATMALLAQFNGTADIRAVQQTNPKAKENVSVDETFVGSYKLDATIAINQGPIFIRPHINVTKEVLKQDDYTALFRINLTNDGNKTLGPIYVTDRLPEGLTFIDSSLRPDITGREIRWSLPMLQIGGKQSITLRASIKDTGSRFINLVDVSAQYNGGVVTARAACGFVLDWLPCCLTVRPTLRPHENVLPNANYIGGGWAPPKSFNLSSNMSEYPLDQEIPCSSCSSDIPENGGCGSCP